MVGDEASAAEQVQETVTEHRAGKYDAYFSYNFQDSKDGKKKKFAVCKLRSEDGRTRHSR